MTKSNEAEPIDVDESDGEDSIDTEQLDEYREMVENLGAFAVSMAVFWKPTNNPFSTICVV